MTLVTYGDRYRQISSLKSYCILYLSLFGGEDVCDLNLKQPQELFTESDTKINDLSFEHSAFM